MDKSKICQRCLKNTHHGVHTCTPTELVRGLEQQLAECQRLMQSQSDTINKLEGMLFKEQK